MKKQRQLSVVPSNPHNAVLPNRSDFRLGHLASVQGKTRPRAGGLLTQDLAQLHYSRVGTDAVDCLCLLGGLALLEDIFGHLVVACDGRHCVVLEGAGCLGKNGSGDRARKLKRNLESTVGVWSLAWYLYFADDSLLLWARSSGMAGLWLSGATATAGRADRGELGASQV